MADKKKIAKGKSISEAKYKERKKKPGQSNLGKYKNVPAKDFAGKTGTFPIQDIEHGRSALRLAHNAKNPSKIKENVYKKYPSLRPGNKKKA